MNLGRLIGSVVVEEAGRDWLDYAAFGLTALAAGLTVATVIFAVKAWKASQANLETAQEGLEIAKKEHLVFINNLTARADFDLSLFQAAPFHMEDKPVKVKGREVDITWSLSLKNVGEKAAGHTGINFLVPSTLKDPKWVTQRGEEIPDPEKCAGPVSTFEKIGDGKGMTFFCNYLIKALDRVSSRGSMVMFARATLILPEVGDERVVAVKAKAWADELPDDVDEAVNELQITFVRVS